ncbi:DUF4127 family protein [soil metagenome]
MTGRKNPRIALLPLDERPVTAHLPAQIAAVAGAETIQPPAAIMPRGRAPGDCEALGTWLNDVARTCDLSVISLELLGLGGLIPSRIGHEPVDEILRRWQVVRELPTPVFASAVVLRTPDADDADEEPPYYAEFGRALHATSAVLALDGQPDKVVPHDVASDFFGRRLRNHILNLAAVGMALDGSIDHLVLGADDTATEAVGTAEQAWISRWQRWLGLDERASTYPGADEIGAVLVARALAAQIDGWTPEVALHAHDGLHRVAPYENVPVEATVMGQLRGLGAALAVEPRSADLHLVVHPPATRAGDFATAPPATTDIDAAEATTRIVMDLLDRGCPVAVADCAYANGADPALVGALGTALGGQWDALAGYAGWNTAGNSIGTALAHGIAKTVGELSGTLDRAAHQKLIMHRLLEDWGWMSSARAAVRRQLDSDPSRHDRVPADGSAELLATELLTERLMWLDDRWRLSGVAFPWSRTFEIDFGLTQL